MIIHKQDNEVISACFAGGGELILVASKRASADDVSDYGTVEEYLLSLDPTPHVSKPIVLSNTASFCNDRCMAISNCGLFLLIALYLLFIRFHLVSHFQRKFNQCIILVMVHRTIVITILSSTQILRRMNSQSRMFSRIMQQSVHESEEWVESSYCTESGYY